MWVEDGVIIAEGAGGEPDTTNNRMELKALIEAYRALPEDANVTVYSDSQLCVNTINEWAAGWESRGWKRKGGEIKNLDLVQAALGDFGCAPRREARAGSGPTTARAGTSTPTRWLRYDDRRR